MIFSESFASQNFVIWFLIFLEINETKNVATNEPQMLPPTRKNADKKQKVEPELKPDKWEKSSILKKNCGRPKNVADQQKQNGDSAKEIPASAKGIPYFINLQFRLLVISHFNKWFLMGKAGYLEIFRF